MAITRRYQPSWPSDESAWIGIDYAEVIPPGVILTAGTLIIAGITPPFAQDNFTLGPVTLIGRQAWCLISGGMTGIDYQCRWLCADSNGQIWSRVALLLCADTS